MVKERNWESGEAEKENGERNRRGVGGTGMGMGGRRIRNGVESWNGNGKEEQTGNGERAGMEMGKRKKLEKVRGDGRGTRRRELEWIRKRKRNVEGNWRLRGEGRVEMERGGGARMRMERVAGMRMGKEEGEGAETEMGGGAGKYKGGAGI